MVVRYFDVVYSGSRTYFLDDGVDIIHIYVSEPLDRSTVRLQFGIKVSLMNTGERFPSRLLLSAYNTRKVKWFLSMRILTSFM